MDRLQLFPISTKIENDNLTIAGFDLASLVDQYGTPLYIYDRATMDYSAQSYADALSSHYPAPSHITYAGKAFLCKAIVEWAQSHGFSLDCTGQGEIGMAVAGRVPREHVLVHGVNKSTDDLKSATRHAGTIVVDNLTELRRLHVILGEAKDLPTVKQDSSIPTPPPGDMVLWLRLLPGIPVSTHHTHTLTGQPDSKFGMTWEEILEAVDYCQEHDLPLAGLHFHQGSNFRDPEPLVPAIELALDLAKEIGFTSSWHFCPGGGWGVASHEDELPHPSIESYVSGIAEAVVEGCRARGLDLPHLHLEPGRSLVGRAGVAVYRIGAVKRRGDKTWLLTDGGMADNPRFALYRARYSCLPVSGVSREGNERVSIAGPYCESGDILIENIFMPGIDEGELIAIPVSGAYHMSMSSNYNGARRPAVVMVEEGSARPIILRENVDDLLKNHL